MNSIAKGLCWIPYENNYPNTSNDPWKDGCLCARAVCLRALEYQQIKYGGYWNDPIKYPKY